MSESWFKLDNASRIEILDIAADKSGRPAHLLEKDIWVVWALSALFSSNLSGKLTFKGGTSLSKVYKIISRFSEDIDLTYDIRELVSDVLRSGNPIPENRSQEKKISSAVIERLPNWITSAVVPIIKSALEQSEINAELVVDGKRNDSLLIKYDALKTGTGYSSPIIKLEFGARATGEPHSNHDVACDVSDINNSIQGVIFPTATPLVMAAERTFWEKATASHVYCNQHELGQDRFSRHWYDLAAFKETDYFQSAITDKDFSNAVAQHKSMFFREKDASGNIIDYFQSINGQLQLIPSGDAFDKLQKDYTAMLEDGLLSLHSPTFDVVIEKCSEIEGLINNEANAFKLGL